MKSNHVNCYFLDKLRDKQRCDLCVDEDTAYHTTRRRRLSSITRAHWRKVIGVPSGPTKKAPLNARLELRGEGWPIRPLFGRSTYETNVVDALAAPRYSARLTTAREESVYQRCLALASLQMKSFAVGRAVAHMNPPAAVPQTTGAET